ncbi:MAG TPA: hypothetical protein VFD43_03945, partial [Planctomycetota bacterium]|nr:hypothetical protein [Planctomycetota bacterium]
PRAPPAPDAQREAPPAASGDTAAAPAPAVPAAPPAPARSVDEFQWPEPLPPCSPDAPALFKGLVVGTWEPDGAAGFDESWVDEPALREAWTRNSVSRRTWKGFTVSDAAVRVDALLADRTGPAVGYLFSLVSRGTAAPELGDAPAVLHVRHNGRLRAFVDGLAVLDLPAPQAGAWGEARAPVVLSGPYTVLLLKLGRGSPELGPSMDVEVRVSAPDGSPLPEQSWNTMRPGHGPPGG